MADTQKVVAPRLQTPQSVALEAGRGTPPIPTDLLAEQCTRLEVLYIVAAALWSIGLLMDGWLLPRPDRGVPAFIIEAVGVLAALGMWAYARLNRGSFQRNADIGLIYMLPNALAIALINSWPEQPTTGRPLSWITIMILVYAIIAPAPPRKMLTVSLIAATMDPLGIWIAHLRGLPAPSVLLTFLMFVPNYVCAVLSLLPYQIVNKLDRRIQSAREMGSYRLVELLGRGGMGEVWRAHHRLLARHAAIKLVRPEVLGAGSDTDTRTVMRRFEREAQATAVLSSPYSIQLFDFGTTDDGMFYYVMELLTGRDMESFVREFGPVSADRALYLLR